MSGLELARQGLCECCKAPLQHGTWSEPQINEVVADLGMDKADFGDYCDPCFVRGVAGGDATYAQTLVQRPLTLDAK